jgi:sugar lactone lactonase YvrE
MVYRTMSNVHYIIKVIEPDKEYLKTFIDTKLDNCKRDAQEYLWSCPEGTKYLYVATRLKEK